MGRQLDGDGATRPFGLEAADQDPDLAIRGYVMARSGVLPTDPSFLALSQNDELLAWTYRWLRKVEDDGLAALMKILGVLWSRDDVDHMVNSKEGAKVQDEAMIPLALAVNPELREGLQKIFRITKGRWIGGGEYQGRAGDEVVELGDLPPEEFLQWANAATGALQGMAQEQEHRRESVTISNDDPRISKIRDQIKASKRLR